ncbi:hypothetical protein, partial [Devosia submarina]|uniref:hypothetical protein n=1 Tax=Devosia submarina TaxID=1173082 RepID=UPI001AEC92E5
TPVGDLTHRVPLELVGEIGFAHKGLLASKLGKKASTNLGAIHSSAIWEIQMQLQSSQLLLVFRRASAFR